ncbi:hypothetical protein GCM10008932_02670 [Alkalibacterium iburiense]|uniref:NAD(P)H-hydrate epimerase n=1 Tax=Alkalibacterium iburiense TaxID=290589 RepID=A0ABN0X228_9LACT
MNSYVSAVQMKAIDHYTIEEIGIPSSVLMERASLEIANSIIRNYDNKKIVCVCGMGNNGGDGVAIGRILFLKGLDVTLYLAGNLEKASDQMKLQVSIARKLSIPIVSTLPSELDDGTVVVDALVGIGLNRDIDSQLDKLITFMNQSQSPVISVDIPSGLSADEGRPLKNAVKATKTYTIGFMKNGFAKTQSKAYTGDIEVVDIGYPPYKLIKHIMEREEINE